MVVEYNIREKKIINHFKAFKPRDDIKLSKYEQYLSLIPQDHKRYKCHDCFKILYNDDLIDGKCPICKSNMMLKEMCPLDHNGCGHIIQESIIYCPVCGEPTCPTCGDHNVLAISRITGYIQDLSGFNMGKRAEHKDRVRVNLNVRGEMISVHQN